MSTSIPLHLPFDLFFFLAPRIGLIPPSLPLNTRTSPIIPFLLPPPFPRIPVNGESQVNCKQSGESRVDHFHRDIGPRWMGATLRVTIELKKSSGKEKWISRRSTRNQNFCCILFANWKLLNFVSRFRREKLSDFFRKV